MIRDLKKSGQLDAEQIALYFEPRPKEELYNLENDPKQLNNLAGDPDYQDVLRRMRNELNEFMVKYDDGVHRLRTADEFDRITDEPLPNNRLPRPSKKEMYGDCECLYTVRLRSILTMLIKLD